MLLYDLSLFAGWANSQTDWSLINSGCTQSDLSLPGAWYCFRRHASKPNSVREHHCELSPSTVLNNWVSYLSCWICRAESRGSPGSRTYTPRPNHLQKPRDNITREHVQTFCVWQVETGPQWPRCNRSHYRVWISDCPPSQHQSICWHFTFYVYILWWSNNLQNTAESH